MPALPDYLTREDLAAWLDPETLDRLARHALLVSLDGGPCWEARWVEDLLRGPRRPSEAP